jgi:hypothetical protein
MIRLAVLTLLLLVAALPPPARAEDAPMPHPYRLEGFRSAKFGMTEAELRRAIRKDFKVGAKQIRRGENPAQRTTVLSVAAKELLPGTGEARLTYILGYRSKRLIEVSVYWTTVDNPRAKATEIVAAANALRSHFLGLGYDPASIATNVRQPDGSVLVFRGADAGRRATFLVLATGGGDAATREVVLRLSYVQDPQHPDIDRGDGGS